MANNRRVVEFLGAENTGRLVISSILRPRWISFFGQRHDRPNTLLVRFLPAALIGWQRAAKPDVAAGGPVHANDLGTANVDFADAASIFVGWIPEVV
jgi:hypothetical protein